ncbi:hypothetical protein [Streptomyces sp. NPDC017991]|uniref:hypothetical protein n=1 Tax=Streptomyces sp. NPDC017991 TaxID=3365026 RepID=UPI0037BC09D0
MGRADGGPAGARGPDRRRTRRTAGPGTHEGSAEILLGTARRLTAHGGHSEGLLAAALTVALGTRTDWRQPWRDRLGALRRHPVAGARDAVPARTTAYE